MKTLLTTTAICAAILLAACNQTPTQQAAILNAVELTAPCALALVQAGAAANVPSSGVTANAVNVLNVAGATTAVANSGVCTSADVALVKAIQTVAPAPATTVTTTTTTTPAVTSK